MDRRRRQALVLAAAAPLPLLSRAQPKRRFAVLPLLASKLDVVASRAEIGSRLDPNQRYTFDDPQGAFDRFAAAAVERAIKGADPSAAVTLMALPRTSIYYEEPQRLFEGRSVALPGNVVDALLAAKATHLLLLTRHRDATRLPLVNSTTGTGTVRGLGFYVDGSLRLTDMNSGESTYGVLAPFVYLRLALVDVESGEVVRDRTVTAMSTYLPTQKSGTPNPWDVLDAEQKVGALKQLLDKELAVAVPELLR